MNRSTWLKAGGVEPPAFIFLILCWAPVAAFNWSTVVSLRLRLLVISECREQRSTGEPKHSPNSQCSYTADAAIKL